MRRWVWVALLAFAGACDDATGPDNPGRVEIEPPSLFRTLWTEVETCSGLTAPFVRVRWFAVYAFRAGPGVLGQWNERREITLRSDVWLDREVIRHEILHDLLSGDRDHRRPEWGACGIDTGVPEGVSGR